MKVRLNVSILGAVLMLALGIATYLAVPYCIAEAATSTDVGPRAFPQLICMLVCVLSVFQIILALLKKVQVVYREISLEKYGAVLLAVALALVTAVLSNYISVVLAAMACSVLYLAILRVRDYRGYLAVLATGGLLYVLMRFALHIRF